MNRIILTLAIGCLFNVSLAQIDVIDEVDYNRAVQLYNEARMDFDQKLYNSAISKYGEAFLLNTSNSDYSFGLAISYYKVSAFDSAKKYIEIAMTLQSGQPDYYYCAGDIYFHTKRYQKAVDNYKLALANLSSEFPINVQNCYYNKAVSEFYLKDYNSAISDLNVIINEDSLEFSYVHLRGVSLLKLGRNEEACQSFLLAQSLGGQDSERYLKKYCK